MSNKSILTSRLLIDFIAVSLDHVRYLSTMCGISRLYVPKQQFLSAFSEAENTIKNTIKNNNISGISRLSKMNLLNRK